MGMEQILELVLLELELLELVLLELVLLELVLLEMVLFELVLLEMVLFERVLLELVISIIGEILFHHLMFNYHDVYERYHWNIFLIHNTYFVEF